MTENGLLRSVMLSVIRLPLLCNIPTLRFHGCKNVNFQKNIIKNYYSFLILLKTEILGSRLNRLIEAVLTSTNNLILAKIRKKSENPSFKVIYSFLQSDQGLFLLLICANMPKHYAVSFNMFKGCKNDNF